MNAYAFFWTLRATAMLISAHFTWKNLDSAVNVEPDYAGLACTTSFPQIVTIDPVVLTV